MDRFGHFGYAAWFILLEIVAHENGSIITGRGTFSVAFLRRNLRTSATKLQDFLDFCQTNGRLSFDISDGKVDVYIPNLQKIKDNYSSDLEAASKKPSNQKEGEKEKEEEFTEREDAIEGYGAQVVKAWNTVLGEPGHCDKVLSLTPDRRRAIKYNSDGRDVFFWKPLFQKIARNERLRRNPKTGWSMTFDFLFSKPAHIAAVLEFTPKPDQAPVGATFTDTDYSKEAW